LGYPFLTSMGLLNSNQSLMAHKSTHSDYAQKLYSEEQRNLVLLDMTDLHWSSHVQEV